jgi:hypothetical protein
MINEQNEVLQELDQPTADAQPESTQEATRQSEQQKHFRAIKEQKDRAERERDEAYRQLQELQRSAQGQQQPEDTDDDFNIDPDALAEGKHLKKMHSQLKQLQTQLKKQQESQQQESVEIRLKSQYPDFDQVVSATNIATLKEKYPHFAQTIYTSSDLYSKSVTAYSLIKELGIEPMAQNARREEEQFEANKKRPKSAASLTGTRSDSPLAQAGSFNFDRPMKDDERKAMWKEMKEVMEGGGRSWS